MSSRFLRGAAAAVLALLFVPAAADAKTEARIRWERMCQIRADKFDLVLPEAMRGNGIDMWITVMKEGLRDPLWPDLGHGYVGSTGYIIFTDRGGDRIERVSIGATGYKIERCGVYDQVVGSADLAEFVRRLGWADEPVFFTKAVPSSSLHAVVDYGVGDVPVLAAHSSPSQTSERFLLARSLCLQARSPGSERRLVTSSHTWDQRASRAFAAELLAPADALRQRIRDQAVSTREVAQYADEFLVSPTLVERQLENHALAQVDRGRQDLRQW